MGLRASDEDRERTVAILRGHQAAGRLTLEELEERSAAAWAAVEVADLGGLTADLPRDRPAPLPATRRPPRVPGHIAFTTRWRAAVRPDTAMAELLAHVAPPLARFGYDLVERTPDRAVFARRHTPAWVVACCVFLFPFGLIALAARNEERITVDLVDHHGETLLVAHGTAPLPVRRAFASLEEG